MPLEQKQPEATKKDGQSYVLIKLDLLTLHFEFPMIFHITKQYSSFELSKHLKM